MQLERTLEIHKGITAIIGGGGKTTLLYALADELKHKGRVIVCTTTHIMEPDHIPCILSDREDEILAVLEQNPVVCVGSRCPNGKLTAPILPFSVLKRLADYVLTEADGSRHLPLKAHASHEPVIPPDTDQTILVVGVTGLNRPIREAAFTPELYARRLGLTVDDIVTPELAAKYVKLENLHTRVLVNQVETEKQQTLAYQFANALSCPVCVGALQKGRIKCLY